MEQNQPQSMASAESWRQTGAIESSVKGFSSLEFKNYVLFCGNPGVGKSTLLNCIIKEHGKSEDIKPFESGVSIGAGLTTKLASQPVDDVIYLDTPGLSDVKLRKQAAEEIHKALKQDGEYKVIFVVTLESGRVRPDDVTTISLVLRSVPEILYFGVIFNKIGRAYFSKITDDVKETLLAQITLGHHESQPVAVSFFVENNNALDDEDDVIVSIPGLSDFVNSLPFVMVNQGNVNPIPYEEYDELKKQMEEKLEILKSNNEQMREKIRIDKEKYQNCLRLLEKQQKKKRAAKDKMQQEVCTAIGMIQSQLGAIHSKQATNMTGQTTFGQTSQSGGQLHHNKPQPEQVTPSRDTKPAGGLPTSGTEVKRSIIVYVDSEELDLSQMSEVQLQQFLTYFQHLQIELNKATGIIERMKRSIMKKVQNIKKMKAQKMM